MSGRPPKYSSRLERLLHIMLSITEEDGTISRYRLKMKTAAWLRKPEMDDLLREGDLTQHTRENKWKGKYYLAADVADRLSKISDERSKQLRSTADALMTEKPW